MRFLIDENLPNDLVPVLAEHGHDARHALDNFKPGCLDPKLFDHAQKEGRILITCDLDFSDIRLYPPGKHAGIIILRIEPQNALHFVEVLESFLRTTDVPSCAKAIVWAKSLSKAAQKSAEGLRRAA